MQIEFHSSSYFLWAPLGGWRIPASQNISEEIASTPWKYISHTFLMVFCCQGKVALLCWIFMACTRQQ